MKCAYCSCEFSSRIAMKMHRDNYHREETNPKIGRKYQRIVGTIEKCFYQHHKKNIEVLSLTQIQEWIFDNTRNGLSKQRLSNFLRRRPQFVLQRKSRYRSTSHIETWWSLGETDIEMPPENGPHWQDLPI